MNYLNVIEDKYNIDSKYYNFQNINEHNFFNKLSLKKVSFISFYYSFDVKRNLWFTIHGESPNYIVNHNTDSLNSAFKTLNVFLESNDMFPVFKNFTDDGNVEELNFVKYLISKNINSFTLSCSLGDNTVSMGVKYNDYYIRTEWYNNFKDAFENIMIIINNI